MKIKTLFKTAQLFIVLSLTMVVYASDKRIINGTAADISEFPWMVNIFVIANDETGEGGSCGGSLIHPEWVLTAAHCFLNEEGTAVDLNSGANTWVTINSTTLEPIENQGGLVKSEKVIIHPSYNPAFETSANPNDNDIALLKLSEKITLVNPLSIIDGSSQDLNEGTITSIMGWGATSINSEGESDNPSNSLLKVDQKLVSNTNCAAIYEQGITDNMLCAGGLDANDRRDSCQGDSGGPLVYKSGNHYVQVGITSFGGKNESCGEPGVPGVYTKVARYKSFIEANINGINFVTIDNSQDTTSVSNTNSVNNQCETRVDSNLSITIPCLVFQGQVYKTSMILVDELYWQWSGTLENSSCANEINSCTIVDPQSYDLIIQHALFDGNYYNAYLYFDYFNSQEQLYWGLSEILAE